jgi:O-antigen/teichoic acid export membrane protein
MTKAIFKNKLFKETFWSFASKIVASIFFIALNIFLARFLSPDKFGTWSYFLSILNILLFLSYFGINSSAKKFIAQHNKTENLGNILKSSFKIRLFFTIFFLFIYLLIIKYLVIIIKRPDFEILFLISLPIIFFSTFIEYFKNVFDGLHRLKYTFFITLSEHGLKFILTIFLLFFIKEINGIINSFSLALFLSFVIGFYLFYFNFYKNTTTSNLNFTKEILNYSLPLFFIGIGFIVATEIDTVMIGFFYNDTEVGIYSIAKQITAKLPHIAVAISLGTMPIFAKINKENKEALKNIFLKLLKINGLIFGIISLLIITTGWFFIPLIFGKEYSASFIPLVILNIYMILFSFSIFLSNFLDYQGKAKIRAFNMSITIFLNIILNYLLIPKFGAIGAATATSISYLPYTILNWLEVKRNL